ncbi:HAD family hydrolase [Acidobacteriota bacterium]
MIKSVISDLGRVMIHFDNRIFFRRMELYSDYTAEEMEEMVDQYLPTLRAFDEGLIPPAEFHRRVTGILRTGIDADVFFPMYNDVFSLIPGNLEVLKSLKDKYRMVLFSNTDVERYAFIIRKFPEILFFDEYVLSYEVGIMKPHPDIYKVVVERAKAKPEECVFIDDREENIAAAVELNICTIHLLPDTDLSGELSRLGVVPG